MVEASGERKATKNSCKAQQGLCLHPYPPSLNMEAAASSETSPVYHATWCYSLGHLSTYLSVGQFMLSAKK